MRILADSHHSGLCRSLVLLLQHRLGHELYFPSGEFTEWSNAKTLGLWLTPNMAGNGGVPEQHLNEAGELRNVIGMEQFMEMDWDAVIISRPESEPLFRELLAKHQKGDRIKRIGQAGNEGTLFDWSWVPNFLSSDYLSFVRAPKELNKLHYMQEVGHQFQPREFTPLTEGDLRTVNTFINCLDSFTDWRWSHDIGLCPHCDSIPLYQTPTIAVAEIWKGMKSALPEHQFRDYGINNSLGMRSERELPSLYLSGALTWGFKTYDGFGHSLAQAVSMGRLVLVPRRFHRYRTANQFLINNLTCLEADWTAASCIEVIRWFTDSLDRANAYSEACFKAARGLFNWKFESDRVRDFLEKLR